jgi:membrane-bound serine protease (ClpP class)
MFLLLALLLLVFLPTPWNVVAAVASLAAGGAELLYFYRRMRGVKVVTGVENLVGAVGKAVERLEPEGHVRVHGELWEARARQVVPPGARVRVVGLDGLTLEVESAETAPAPVLPAR